MSLLERNSARRDLPALLAGEAASKAARVGAEIGQRAEQLAETAAGSVSDLAHKTIGSAEQVLRRAPESLRHQVGAGTQIMTKLPRRPAVRGRPAAGRRPAGRRLLAALAAVVALSFLVSMAMRLARKKKRQSQLAPVDDLLERPAVDDSPPPDEAVEEKSAAVRKDSADRR